MRRRIRGWRKVFIEEFVVRREKPRKVRSKNASSPWLLSRSFVLGWERRILAGCSRIVSQLRRIRLSYLVLARPVSADHLVGSSWYADYFCQLHRCGESQRLKAESRDRQRSAKLAKLFSGMHTRDSRVFNRVSLMRSSYWRTSRETVLVEQREGSANGSVHARRAKGVDYNGRWIARESEPSFAVSRPRECLNCQA